MLSLAHFSEFGHHVPYKLNENFDRIRLNYGYFTLKLVRLKFSYTIWGTGNDLRPLYVLTAIEYSESQRLYIGANRKYRD